MTKEIFKIINRVNGTLEGAYSRAYHTEYEFDSVNEARASNVNDVYQNRARYKIQKWKVTYELIDDDVDPPNKEELSELAEYNEDSKEILLELDKLGITDAFERMDYASTKMNEKRRRRIYNKLASQIEQFFSPAKHEIKKKSAD